MTPQLNIQMFGRLYIAQGGNQIHIETHKALELFCYLLLHRHRAHSRDSLVETIWGETTAARGKKYLRQALWQIQSGLASHSNEDNIPLLLTEGDWVQINPEAKFCLDVAEFEASYSCVRDQSGKELEEEGYLQLKNATMRYQGDLLEGWYDDWCLFERERLQNIYLVMLDKLMGYCEAHYAYEEALSFGENILRYDVARERTHRRMVRIYYMAGERTAALRQYERCVTSLEEELGVKPAQKTVDLYEQICYDRSTYIEQTPIQSMGAVSSPEIIERLHQLEKMVEDFREKISQELRTIEKTLKH
jgi:DNA-binding SARP family transcriptional activator